MRLKINEDIQHCWFGYYLDVKGNKKYFYMTKDSTSKDPDEASEIMEDSIPEPFTKFVFQGSVANTQAEKQGWKLVESKESEEYNIKTGKLKEGSYDFGEYKKQAETVEARIAEIIGAYSKDMHIPYNSSGYRLTRQDKDHRFTKQNFYVYPFGYGITKNDELEMKNSIKSAGGKYIVSSYGNIHFYIDETPFITARDNEQAEIDNDFKLRKSEYENKLNTEDIEKYKPTDKILNKLQDYRSNGSKVNVKAIKNIDKLLTYYYAACIMDWKDLKYSCEENIPAEYKDIKNAISFRCDAQDNLVDTRDKDTQDISTQFNRITAFLHSQHINYTFKRRKPTYTELELDRRNGRCWTLGYTLELSNGTSINFANHTNEGGGTYGYSVNGGARIGKKEAEDRIIQIIKNSLSTNIDESLTCHKLSENYWIDNKEVMDEVDRLGKELADDGWNSYADKYTGKAYYWIFVKQENNKAVAKAIIYNHNIEPEVIDITIDQAIGQSSLDSNDALRRKLGKMLLPQNESKLVAESSKISNENSVVEFAKDCKELGYPVESYEEFSKILRDNNMTATEELYNLYVDTMNSYVVESIPIFGAKAKKDLNEFAYKIDDLKAFYNTSDSIDKNKFPNFFVWYDDMVKSGKLHTESMELNESRRYKGENKFGQNLSQEHLDELKNEPGKVFNFAKFDIFYGENKGHFPFKPCYYVTYRPSNYTSIFLDDEEILRYINANFKESCIKESYIEIDNAVDTIDELGYAGATEIRGNKIYADEETLRQIISELDFTPEIIDSNINKNKFTESLRVDEIADYIEDYFTFNSIDDKYDCVNEIVNNYNTLREISVNELKPFVIKYNGKDKVNESKPVKESKDIYCVYFEQDGYEQLEFTGTIDECNKYISDIQAEQDDESGDEAPERFIKRLSESSEGFQKEFYCNYVILRSRVGDGWDIYSYDGTPEKVTKAYLEDEGFATLQAAKDEIDKWNDEAKLDESIEYFASVTSLADECGENTHKVSSRDIKFRFVNENDETKFINKLYELDIPYTQAAYGVIVSKSSALDESTQPLYIIKDKFNDLENIDEQFSDNIVKELEKYFKENNAAYILDELYYSKPRNVIEFDINNGDWKHEHLWAKRLIQEFFEKLDMDISIESFETQTDGSDCYSAHYTIYPGIKRAYKADIKESAIEEDYTPDMLDDLINHYAGRTDFATIWDEITNKFNDEDLANDVIEALELQASDLWEKYLTESKELSNDHAIISVVDQVKAVYEAGLFDKLPIGRDKALTLDIFGPDKERLAGYFKKQKEFNYEINHDNGIVSHEFISDKYDIEIFDSFISMYKIPQE